MDELRLTFWIARLRKSLTREFEARARKCEITVPQFYVLRCLWARDGLLTTALAAESGSDGATLTGVLDRLEGRGLLRRERCTDDRRAVRIFLTPAGRALERPLLHVVADVNRR